MRSRGSFLPILLLALLALLASSCSGGDPGPTAADRAVGDDSPTWDVDQAILRTEIIESGLDDGLGRTASGCMIDTTLDSEDFALEDLEGINLTAQTGSGARSTLAATLADALIDCGPSLRAFLKADIPGALAVPGTHAVEAECLTNAYVEAWRDEYTDRFGDRVIADEEPVPPEVDDQIVGIIAGCDAGGAVILGASNLGHLDTHALSTLEWECLEARIGADDFLPAFPFPEEPGDALGRLGSRVLPDVTFCEAWVSGEDVPDGGTDAAENDDAASGGFGADAVEKFTEVDDAIG